MTLPLPAPYTIRPMLVDDLEAVLIIDALSFPTPIKSHLLQYELNENQMARYYCLLEGEQLIGYDGFWLIGDEMHISTIAVHPHWRSKGLGELLLQQMLSMAQQSPITMVTLEVRESNQTAQSLYKKYQFQQVGIRPNYYRDTQEVAILMTLSPLNAPYANFFDEKKRKLLHRLGGEED